VRRSQSSVLSLSLYLSIYLPIVCSCFVAVASRMENRNDCFGMSYFENDRSSGLNETTERIAKFLIFVHTASSFRGVNKSHFAGFAWCSMRYFARTVFEFLLITILQYIIRLCRKVKQLNYRFLKGMRRPDL
jgi:hypothetical protein